MIDRLDQMPIETGVGRFAAVFVLAPAGEGDDLHRFAPLFRTQRAARVVAVHHWHADVEQDHRGPEFFGEAEGFLAVVSRLHLIAR